MGRVSIHYLAQQFKLGEIQWVGESFKLLVKRDNEYTVVSL